MHSFLLFGRIVLPARGYLLLFMGNVVFSRTIHCKNSGNFSIAAGFILFIRGHFHLHFSSGFLDCSTKNRAGKFSLLDKHISSQPLVAVTFAIIIVFNVPPLHRDEYKKRSLWTWNLCLVGHSSNGNRVWPLFSVTKSMGLAFIDYDYLGIVHTLFRGDKKKLLRELLFMLLLSVLLYGKYGYPV